MSINEKLAVSTGAIELSTVTVRLPKEMHTPFIRMSEQVCAWLQMLEDVRSFALGISLHGRDAQTHRVGFGLVVTDGLFAEGVDGCGTKDEQLLVESERICTLGALCAGAEARGERRANDAADGLVDEFHARDRPLEKERAKIAAAKALQAAYMASFNETRSCARIMTVDPRRYFPAPQATKPNTENSGEDRTQAD